MFKSPRWRNEKNKFKAVFKLQFHATQLEQVGGDALMISLVPADVGKPTVISEKAAIRDGSCFWENPVYETVKLFQEPHSVKIHQKIYYFVISTGSSKAGLVGEVSIDFARYAESSIPSPVTLPLKNTKCDAILHVSIQRLPENVDQRDSEDNENVKVNSPVRSLRTRFRDANADVSINSNSTEDVSLTNKIPHVAGLNGNRRAYNGSDLTVSSSESSSGLSSPMRSLCPGEVNSEEKLQEASETMIEKLKTELVALSRAADVSELELQSLRKQIVKESKRGQDLLREVVTLKEERDALKEKCEKLVDEPRVGNKLKFQGGDPCAHLEELRQELIFEKDLNSNLRLQLQKTHESNAELILAVRDLDTMVEQKDEEIFTLSNRLEGFQGATAKLETDNDEQQGTLKELVMDRSNAKERHAPDKKSMDVHSELERCRREKDDLEMLLEQLSLDYEILKQENNELSYRLEQSQVQEQLKMQYECWSPYAIVNELETQIENLETELEKQSNKFSESLATVTDLETHIKDLEGEMEKQAEGFETSLEILMGVKVEQEQRAIRAEAGLKKMQWQNLDTAERLQDELRRVSVEVAFALEANEKMTTKAVMEASELKLQKSYLEELVWKTKEEIRSVRDLYQVTFNDMESKIKHGEETRGVLSREILALRSEIESLEKQNNSLSEEVECIGTLKDELEKMKTSMAEKEMLLVRGNGERNDLESMVALLLKDIEETHRVRSRETLMLRVEIERLETQNKTLLNEVESIETLKDELDQMKTSMAQKEMQLVRGNAGKNDLESMVVLLKKDIEETHRVLSREILSLRAEIERLKTQNNSLSDEVEQIGTLKDELEQMKTSMAEKEMLLLRGNAERNDLESMVALLKEDIEETHRVFLQEILTLRSEIERLETQNNSLSEEVECIGTLKDELEKMKTSMAEKEMLLVRGNVERNDLESMVALLKTDVEETRRVHSRETLMLRVEIERLETQNKTLSDEVERIETLKNELDQMKTSMSQKEMLLLRGNAERNDLESMVALLKKDVEEAHRVLSREKLMLRVEIERLETQNSTLSEEVERLGTLKDELEQMKTSIAEKEMLLLRGNAERNDMESMVALLKKEAEKLTEELNLSKGLKDENELIIGNLQSELEIVQSKHNESKYLLIEDDFEKEELRNRECQFEGEINEGAFGNLETQLKDNEAFCLVGDSEGIDMNGSSIPEEVKNASMMSMIGSCDEDSLGRGMEASISSTLNKGYVDELLKEMELLRGKNTSMAGELKQMQEMYSEISLHFAEVEGERQRLLMSIRNRKNRNKG